MESLVAGQITEFEVSRLIGENSEVWFRGLNGEELTQPEEATFEAVANAVFRLFANDYYRVTIVQGISGRNIANSYAFFVYQYPGLRRKFHERGNAQQLRNCAYGLAEELPFFGRIVNELLQQLDESSPEVPSGNYLPL